MEITQRIVSWIVKVFNFLKVSNQHKNSHIDGSIISIEIIKLIHSLLYFVCDYFLELNNMGIRNSVFLKINDQDDS